MKQPNPFDPPAHEVQRNPTAPVVTAALGFGLAAAVAVSPFAWLVASGGLDFCSPRLRFDLQGFLTMVAASSGGGAVVGASVWAWRWSTSHAGAGRRLGLLVAFLGVYGCCGLLTLLSIGSGVNEPFVAFAVSSVFLTVFVLPIAAPVGAVTGLLLERLHPLPDADDETHAAS